MGEIEDRLERLESLVEHQQERVAQQQETIERQQETIAEQRERIATLEARADADGSGEPSVSRRGAMKTAGLVGLLGAGVGAATAGPTVGEPDNQIETLYAEGLSGDLTGGTTVTDLAGAGLTVNSGSLGPSLSSDLTLSNGDIAVDVGPDDIGAASDSHGNAAHSSNFIASLSGGAGISQGTLGDGDTVSVDWADAAGLESGGSVDESQLSAGTPPNLVQSDTTNAGSNSASGNGASTVAGGLSNTVQDGDQTAGGAFVGAGAGNSAEGAGGAICSGQNNEMRARRGFIGAGQNNEIFAGVDVGGAIVGGRGNVIDGAVADAFIGGGFQNEIGSFGSRSFIGCGASNTIGESCDRSAIVAGGALNTAGNSITGSSVRSFIGAGTGNTVSASDSGTVVGNNTFVGATHSIVGAGRNNSITPASEAAGILGGEDNTVTGAYATIPGGRANEARGDFSLAFGNSAAARADGAVAFADHTDEPFDPDGPGLHAQMGAYLPEVHCVAPADRRADATPLDPAVALDRITDVDAETWEEGLGVDPASFNDAFDLDGEDSVGLLSVTTALLGAVQALADRLDDRSGEHSGATT